MNPVTYDELGRMRLGGFLDDGVELDVEETGMMTLVGLGGFERLGETYFCWKQGEPYHTAGIELDLGPDTILPEESAREILARLRLPVRKGMPKPEIIDKFGSPETDKVGAPGTRWLRFKFGEQELYWLGFVVDDREGLNNLFLARKDYCDESDAT